MCSPYELKDTPRVQVVRVIEVNKGIWLRGDILSTHRVLHFGPSANMLK